MDDGRRTRARATRAALAAVLILVAAVAGCGGSGREVKEAQLAEVVLQPADLPHAFVQFDAGRQVRLDRVPGPRFDETRYGREGGWKARYNRNGTKDTRGPLVVESRVDLFRDTGGADTDLDAYREQFKTTPVGARVVRVPQVGEESVGMTSTSGGNPAVRYVTVAWRDGNVTASVTVNGFAPNLRVADAVALARAQERRIAAALGRG